MKDICCETGLSRGGLYRHYDSTRQIFSEIVNELMSAQDNELSEKMNQGRPAPQILEEILDRYGQEMSDRFTSLSAAIFEFYSEQQWDSSSHMLLKQYTASVDLWRAFISYGVERGEFKNVDAAEIIDVILFSYQGVRMFSTIMPLDEQIPRRIISHVKKALLP